MTARRVLGSKLPRRLTLLLALVVGLALLLMEVQALYLPGSGAEAGHFVEYWGATQLLLRGSNPYDPVALLAVQQAVGWPEPEPVRMWNPPWALVLILPLTILSFGLAAMIWLLVQLGLILGCGALLWRYFAPEDGRHWIGIALAAGFVPGLFALRDAQVSAWLLAGVVGFLWAERSRRDVFAGSALALLVIKPHVTYLFWLAALWWAWRSGRRWVLVGWLAALIGASGIVLLFAPDVFANYLSAAARPPVYWATPTLGWWLRLLFGVDRSWLQFLPSLVGVLLLMVWLGRHRSRWDWKITAPALMLASVLTAAYGWSYDQVVLLPAVVSLVSRLRSAAPTHRAAVAGGLVTSQLALVACNLFQVNEVFVIWHAPLLTCLYWWGVGGGWGTGVIHREGQRDLDSRRECDPIG